MDSHNSMFICLCPKCNQPTFGAYSPKDLKKMTSGKKKQTFNTICRCGYDSQYKLIRVIHQALRNHNLKSVTPLCDILADQRKHEMWWNMVDDSLSH